MIGNALAVLLEKSIQNTPGKTNADANRVSAIARQLLSHPIKMIAAFFTAPILLVRIVLRVKNPVRRCIALVGIIIGIILAIVTGSLLGWFIIASIVYNMVGLGAAIAVFFSAWLSVFISVLCQLLVLNFICFIFLKMSSQEVVDYLNDIST